MVRSIIRIDQDACNGCGLCAQACHEGAIHMVNGKAKLIRDDYCDGLGDCLPVCPANAIRFEEREAAAYDEVAAKARLAAQASAMHSTASQLRQWPVQIRLAPANAPYFANASLLIAADCTAYAYGEFHNHFMQGNITLIGCPKLDRVSYEDKLTSILKNNDIRRMVVTRMEVPCCSGLVLAVQAAIRNSGKLIPLEAVTISTDGTVLAQ